MAKKFKFNHETLDFVEIRHTILDVLRKSMLFIFIGVLMLIGYYAIFTNFFSTPQEKELEKINQQLEVNLELLSNRYQQLEVVVDDINNRDASIYQRVFESSPPRSNVRKNLSEIIVGENNIKLTKQTKIGIDKLTQEVEQQTKLLKDLVDSLRTKNNLQSIPSVQPVNNRDMRRVAATFGWRIHPYYKVLKMHSGVDFSVPLGSEVYATGNAKVLKIGNSMRNTGISITLDHGNGYKTVYNHLHKTSVREGQRVKRGDVIALVGNTGRSVAPHLHYEIWSDNKLVNPLHYFFQDITPSDYQILKEIAANKGQSLD